MKNRPKTFRSLLNFTMISISGVITVIVLSVLCWILWVVTRRGLAAINWEFFTSLPKPPGMEGGGVANAILGSVIITTLATAMAIPPGILAGVYLAEFNPKGKLATAIRFCANIIMSIPSIIVGLFIWSALVVHTGTFSAWAGAVALAIIMFPLVTRTTEDMLRMIPDTLREASLGMGMPYWRSMFIIFRAAKSGIITGILLAIARVSGETAPLLFTALNSPYWLKKLTQPAANLPVTIFKYAMSPYEDWQTKAWGASFLIMLFVLLTSIITRMFIREKHQ